MEGQRKRTDLRGLSHPFFESWSWVSVTWINLGVVPYAEDRQAGVAESKSRAV